MTTRWPIAFVRQVAESTVILVLLVFAADIQVNWAFTLTVNALISALVVWRRFSKHQNGD